MITHLISLLLLLRTDRARGYSTCADSYRSACNNGGGFSYDGRFGYACPQMMMLSDEFVEATRQDGLPGFVYAVAGGASDSECGYCYQVQVLDAEREWRSDFPLLVVQIVNSGYDVMRGQLDLFMGAGGFGYFTACNADCSSAYCQGGPCAQGMYQGTFKDWVNAEYNDPNLCYSGGIKWLGNKNETDLEALCDGLSNHAKDYLGNTTRTSCVDTNVEGFHQNFVSTRYTRVQCPHHLTRVTGLHRLDDATLPLPSPSLSLDEQCLGDRTQGHYCVTTMQDCCKMSCSWSGKIPSYALDPDHPCVFTCDASGAVVS